MPQLNEKLNKIVQTLTNLMVMLNLTSKIKSNYDLIIVILGTIPLRQLTYLKPTLQIKILNLTIKQNKIHVRC